MHSAAAAGMPESCCVCRQLDSVLPTYAGRQRSVERVSVERQQPHIMSLPRAHTISRPRCSPVPSPLPPPATPPPVTPLPQLREKKKEIASLKQEVKRVQQEMNAQKEQAQQAQQQGQQQPAEGAQGDAQPPAAGPQQAAQGAAQGLPPLPPQRASTRRARDFPAEMEAMVTRISKLEQDMNQVGGHGCLLTSGGRDQLAQ